jgi:hypothetical protein
MIISPKNRSFYGTESSLTDYSQSNDSKIQITEEYLFCENRDHENKENVSIQANGADPACRRKRNEQAYHYTDYYLQN